MPAEIDIVSARTCRFRSSFLPSLAESTNAWSGGSGGKEQVSGPISKDHAAN
jgi:hypothetical protein